MKYILSVALTFALSVASHASSVDWNIDGEFKNNAGGVIVSQGEKFKWGLPSSKLEVIEYSGPQNFDGNGHYSVHLLDLTWYNATSLTLPGQHVDLHIDLDWTAPGAGGGSEAYRLGVTNTSDFSFCGFFCLDFTPQDDKISAFLLDDLSFGGVPEKLGNGITVEGYEWVLSEGSDGFFSDGHWYNSEHGTSTLQLKAKVSAVPLPAAGWMLLASMGGLAAMKRRRKAHAD